MSDTTSNFLGILFLLFVWFGGFIFGSFIFYDIGYKKGQVNYARGTIEYSLQKNMNGEKVWTKTEKIKQ